MITIQQLLKTAIQKNASDLHITADSAPLLRVNGKIVRVKSDKLTGGECQNLIFSILTEGQKSKLESAKELDFSFSLKDGTRFRGNVFFQKGNLSGVFRHLPNEVPVLENLHLPKSLEQITRFESGLVLVTGGARSGKTTTIAALIDRINTERTVHILTVENPIEFVFENKKSFISQRELDHDAESLAVALKQIGRQDVDVVFVSQMDTPEAIEAALRLAETGHLVLSTFHTQSAVDTIQRIVSLCEPNQQERVRLLLASNLKAVISQDLVIDADDRLIPVNEVLFVNSTISKAIRENKIQDIYEKMHVGQEKSGMVTLNQSLLALLLRRKIELKTAFDCTSDPEEFDSLLKKAGV